MPLPNFFIIGAAKSGTTSLCALLEQHPDVYMSPEKEPRFFALDGAPLDFRGPGDMYSNATAVYQLSDYLALFAGATTQKAIGEASTLYMFSPTAPARIKASIPHARIIAILRNPVDRAYSNYLHLVRDGRETVSFEDGLRLEEHRTSDLHWSRFWHYKKTGFYFEQLRRYYDVFDRSQIRVYLYEDLRTNQVELSQDVFRFLGIDDMFVPSIVAEYNASGVPRSKFLQVLLFDRRSPLKAVLRPVKGFLPSGIKEAATQLKRRSLAKPELSPILRKELLGTYREDILRLQELIQRDLSTWLA